jgi:hypothetical protein
MEFGVLSPLKGVQSGTIVGGSLSAAPNQVEMYEPGLVYGMELCGVAYRDDFLDEDERDGSFRNLEFLDVE